jgi:hypothetical protein
MNNYIRMQRASGLIGVQGILAARAAPVIVHMDAYAANTLTGVIGSLFNGLNVVSRELVGFIPSVRRNTGVERAAVGQTVTFPIAPAQVATDVVPAMQVPTPPDNTIGTGTMAITKSRKVAFGWTGEEQRAVNTGVGYQDIQADLFAEALRTLVNEMEADIALEGALNASRATGTAGTTPFASDLGASAQVRKILDDNGAPASGRSLIINTAAGAALRTLNNLVRVNESGTTMTLRDGVLLDQHGFAIKESAQAVNFIAGTGAGSTTNAAGYAVGATVITLASAGTGTIKQGDVIVFAGDTNQYVVASGDADVSNGGTITLAGPGLRVAIPAVATAITVRASHAVNLGFSQDALALATRQPALPQEGDLALDRMQITDPRSGMTFEVAIYPGYRMIEAEVAIAWGVKAIKRNHIALLMG